MKKPIYKHMILGTAYYPEHWDKSLWENDIVRMQAHGINMLRIGDFSWSKYEYKEDEFTISYYDEFLELCVKHGMEVLFCTPTAAPPVWLAHKYPEILNRDINGDAYYGPRRHYNYNAPIYRELSERIVEKLAEHYSKWDIIVGWQVDNELNCDLSEYYSEADHAAYRHYLKEKYRDLNNLNESLGLVFWSRLYSDWGQVTLNRKNVGGAVNPHLALEEKRFFSESAISFCKLQVEAIKKHLPDDKFITTNGLFSNLDYIRLMECGLDFITFNSYPNFAFELSKDPNLPGNLNDRKWSWNLMWTRSISPVFGIMEQQSGANGWTTRMETPSPKPGQMKLWTMQSIAHGADMVLYFRWRTSPIGCEIHWQGLNDYANTDNRRLRELKEVGQICPALEAIRGTTFKAKMAVIKDYSNVWDSEVDVWHGRVDSFSDNSWFEATQLTHTPCDLLYASEQTTQKDLSVYEMLVYPHPAIIKPKIANLLKKYVENGGTLIFGARTGYKDQFGRCPMRPMPGIISEWCGVTVTDYTLVGPADGEINVEWNGKLISAPIFNEILKTNDTDTDILASFQGNYYDGQPALCHKSLGKGHVYYLGACFSVEMARTLLEKTNQVSPYKQLLELPEAVELAVRTDGKADYIFVLNYKGAAVNIKIHQALLELISGEECEGVIALQPYDVKVLVLESPNFL
jgi:beta-galactosidase